MDPDEALQKLRELRVAFENGQYVGATDHDQAALDDLLERLDALDAWLSRAGYLPQAWCRAGTDTQPLEEHDHDDSDHQSR